jgi:acetyltransferase-like isoleucine patch superfamily enzyme
MFKFIKSTVESFLLRRNRIKYAAHVEIDDSARYFPGRIHLREKCGLRIGKRSIVECHIFFERETSQVYIGERTFIGASSLMCAEEIYIGDDVLIAFGATIADHNSHSLDFSFRASDVELWYEGKKKWDHVEIKPVRIEDRAWIGMHSIILKGVHIGEGAVVGAGAVVTKDVPPYTLVAGNPAHPMRSLTKPR